MIMVLEGSSGSGKTTALKYFEAVEKNEGKACHWEFHTDLVNCAIFLDERYEWYDCRRTKNRLFSYFVMQTRARRVTLYVTTRKLEMVDKSIRRHMDVKGICFPGNHKVYVHLMSRGRINDDDEVEWVPRATLELPVPAKFEEGWGA